MTLQANTMVRPEGGGPQMKLASIDSAGVATCVLIDHDGALRLRFHAASTLVPMAEAMRPRSAWPSTSHVDLIEIEKEEENAKSSKREKRRAARKAKRSKKIRRDHASRSA